MRLSRPGVVPAQGLDGGSARRREAGIPAEVPFATKPEIGRQMLERALDGGAPVTWVLADEIYGGDYRLRSCVEDRHCRYVLGVAANQYVWVGWEQRRVDAVIRNLEASAWIRLSCGDGTKGPRVYDWARVRLTCPVAGWERWALCRRSLTEPQDLAYFLVFVPSETPLAEIVRQQAAAGTSRRPSRSQGRGGTRPLRGPQLAGLVPPPHPGAAGPRLPRRHPVHDRHPQGVKGGMTEPGVSSLAAFRQRRGLAG